MARGKKTEKTLTPEEKLAQALVPVEEQPYSVPGNWCWVKFGAVCIFENGYAFKSDYFSDSSGVPVIRITNIVDDAIEIENCIYSLEKNIDPKFVVHYGDLLIAMSGATTGKNGVYYSDKLAYLNQRVGNIKIVNDRILLDGYRNIFVKFKTDEILRNAYGGAQPNISSKKICEMYMPLAPFTEQQRIVDRIESLFTKLDEAKEKAQAVVDGLETRKAAILHKAFRGELTERWRTKRGLNADGWCVVCFDSVANIKSNLVDPLAYQDYPHIAPDNIEKKTGALLEYHTIAEDNVKSGKHRFYTGQILYSKIRPYLSKVIIVDFDGLCSADMYPIEAKENTRYLWYYMLSNEFLEQASTAGSRSVLPKINQKELSAIKVRITLPDEQAEIVRILDSIFAKDQQTKETAEAVLDQIDAMKKAILARAFRGKLGTNDSKDGNALELLRRILDETKEN